MKRFLIMVLAAVLGIGVVVTGVSAIVNSDKNVALRAIDGAIEGLCEREEMEYFNNLLTGGSVTADFKSKIDGADVKASGKIYFELENYSLMYDDLSLSVKMGEKKIDITGSAYIDQETVYIQNEEILKGTYGIEKGSLAEGFKKSVFNPDSDSEMALPEEMYDLILKTLEIAESDLPEDMSEDALDLVDTYVTKARKLIFKHAEYSSATEEVKVGGEEIKARVVSVIITPETIANFVADFYEYLKDDDDVRDFLVKYYEEFESAIELAAKTEGGTFDKDLDIGEAYDDAVEALGDQVDKIVEQMKDTDEGFVAIRLATPKSSAKLMKAWVVIGEDVEDIEDDPDDLTEIASIDFGEDGVKKTNAITIIVGGEKIKYTVKEDDDGAITYKLSMGDNAYISLELDEDNEKFAIKFAEGKYTAISVSGKYTTKGDSATFELKKIMSGETNILTEDNDIDLILTFEESDGMPSPEKDIKPILELDKEDIEKITERAMKMFSESEE
jgi:hypothetical protein